MYKNGSRLNDKYIVVYCDPNYGDSSDEEIEYVMSTEEEA